MKSKFKNSGNDTRPQQTTQQQPAMPSGSNMKYNYHFVHESYPIIRDLQYSRVELCCDIFVGQIDLVNALISRTQLIDVNHKVNEMQKESEKK